MKYLIDETNITDFNRTEEDLQAFWLFCILVAGKTAYIQAQKLARFLKPAEIVEISPFKYISLREHKFLDEDIRAEGLGQYKRIHRAFTESVNLDLETCTLEDLESIYGVGPKTARFFLLHSRPNQRYAVLDTHILKWIKDVFDIPVPKATPSSVTRYRELENYFLSWCDDHEIEPANADLYIWNNLSRKPSSVIMA